MEPLINYFLGFEPSTSRSLLSSMIMIENSDTNWHFNFLRDYLRVFKILFLVFFGSVKEFPSLVFLSILLLLSIIFTHLSRISMNNFPRYSMIWILHQPLDESQIKTPRSSQTVDPFERIPRVAWDACELRFV